MDLDHLKLIMFHWGMDPLSDSHERRIEAFWDWVEQNKNEDLQKILDGDFEDPQGGTE